MTARAALQLSTMSTSSPILAIFCKVVDNFGDIGICWRLARQMHAEHGVKVTLWVDDLKSFQRIWPAVDAGAEIQPASRPASWRGAPRPT